MRNKKLQRKNCFLSGCNRISTIHVNQRFVTVPQSRRQFWKESCNGRQQIALWCCYDHFDPLTDFKRKSKRIFIKEEVLPHLNLVRPVPDLPDTAIKLIPRADDTGSVSFYCVLYCRCCKSTNFNLFDMNEKLVHSNDRLETITLIDAYFEMFGEGMSLSGIDESAKICESCWTKLQNAYTFREVCMKTYHELLKNNLYQSDCVSSDTELSEDIKTRLVVQDMTENTSLLNILAPCKQEQESDEEIEAENSLLTAFPDCVQMELAEEAMELENSLIPTHACEEDFKYCCTECGDLFQSVSEFEEHEKIEHFKGKKMQVEPKPAQQKKTEPKTDSIPKTEDNSEKNNESGSPKNRKTVRCDTCQKIFQTLWKLKRHMHTHNNDQDNKNACKKCTKSFYNRRELHDHMVEVHRKVQFICHYCEKKYRDKTALTRHLFVHRGFSPYNCPTPECSYNTRCRREFRIHLKAQHNVIYDETIHGYDEKNAENVRKLFEEKASLNPENTTKPTNSNKCSKCSLTFSSVYALHRHNQIHHLKERFQCKFCLRTFKEKRFLWSHSFKHRAIGYPFKCVQCKFKTRRKRSYVSHLSDQHNLMFDEKIHGFKETYNEVINFVLKTSTEDEHQEDKNVSAASEPKRSSRKIVKPKRFN